MFPVPNRAVAMNAAPGNVLTAPDLSRDLLLQSVRNSKREKGVVRNLEDYFTHFSEPSYSLVGALGLKTTRSPRDSGWSSDVVPKNESTQSLVKQKRNAPLKAWIIRSCCPRLPICELCLYSKLAISV